MKLYLAILCLCLVKVASVMGDDDSFLDDINLDYDEARLFGGRTFNFSTNGINGLFNNTNLLGIGAGIILAIILFEIALYALDVYYNQTYGFGGSSNSYGYQRRKDGVNNEIFNDFPKYQDPYAETYRSLGSGVRLDKILEWIALGRDTYEAGSDTLGDLECQKKMICEVYRTDMGSLSQRARHGLDYLDVVNYLNVPDFLSESLDEFQEAKSSGKDKWNCTERYSSCKHSLAKLKNMYDQL